MSLEQLYKDLSGDSHAAALAAIFKAGYDAAKAELTLVVAEVEAVAAPSPDEGAEVAPATVAEAPLADPAPTPADTTTPVV
jgi:hypothetical protein